MSPLVDVLVLPGLLLFLLGATIASHFAFGIGPVAPPKDVRERLRELAWVPSVVAAVGLVVLAVASGTTLSALCAWAGTLLLVAGLRLPAAAPPVPDRRAAPASSGRHAVRLVRRPVSLRVVVLGCGYLVGATGGFLVVAGLSAG